MMLGAEPAPPPGTINSYRNKSSVVFTLLLCQAAQTLWLGRDVPPIQEIRRRSAWMPDRPSTAWLARLRENEPNTVPSCGARLNRKLAATTLAAAGMFWTMTAGW